MTTNEVCKELRLIKAEMRTGCISQAVRRIDELSERICATEWTSTNGGK